MSAPVGFVHIHDMAGGEPDVEQAVEAGMQGGGDFTADGGFAGADLAGDQPDPAQLQEVVKPDVGFAEGAGGEQRVGVALCLEGEAGEGEVLAVHQRGSV